MSKNIYFSESEESEIESEKEGKAISQPEKPKEVSISEGKGIGTNSTKETQIHDFEASFDQYEEGDLGIVSPDIDIDALLAEEEKISPLEVPKEEKEEEEEPVIEEYADLPPLYSYKKEEEEEEEKSPLHGEELSEKKMFDQLMEHISKSDEDQILRGDFSEEEEEISPGASAHTPQPQFPFGAESPSEPAEIASPKMEESDDIEISRFLKSPVFDLDIEEEQEEEDHFQRMKTEFDHVDYLIQLFEEKEQEEEAKFAPPKDITQKPLGRESISESMLESQEMKDQWKEWRSWEGWEKWKGKKKAKPNRRTRCKRKIRILEKRLDSLNELLHEDSSSLLSSIKIGEIQQEIYQITQELNILRKKKFKKRRGKSQNHLHCDFHRILPIPTRTSTTSPTLFDSLKQPEISPTDLFLEAGELAASNYRYFHSVGKRLFDGTPSHERYVWERTFWNPNPLDLIPKIPQMSLFPASYYPLRLLLQQRNNPKSLYIDDTGSSSTSVYSASNTTKSKKSTIPRPRDNLAFSLDKIQLQHSCSFPYHLWLNDTNPRPSEKKKEYSSRDPFPGKIPWRRYGVNDHIIHTNRIGQYSLQVSFMNDPHIKSHHLPSSVSKLHRRSYFGEDERHLTDPRSTCRRENGRRIEEERMRKINRRGKWEIKLSREELDKLVESHPTESASKPQSLDQKHDESSINTSEDHDIDEMVESIDDKITPISTPPHGLSSDLPQFDTSEEREDEGETMQKDENMKDIEDELRPKTSEGISNDDEVETLEDKQIIQSPKHSTYCTPR
ncbi:hypothetical protein ADUPG1_008916, partial [Aduncisulcus paluster]